MARQKTPEITHFSKFKRSKASATDELIIILKTLNFLQFFIKLSIFHSTLNYFYTLSLLLDFIFDVVCLFSHFFLYFYVHLPNKKF